jgi:hypothetical protein
MHTGNMYPGIKAIPVEVSVSGLLPVHLWRSESGIIKTAL